MVLNRATHHYAPNFIDSCIKQFLNDLYTPIILVQNVSKRDTFVKLPFLGSTSFQIQKRTRKLFTNKLTICNLKIVFRHFLQSKAFSPSKTRCYFQDLFTSIGAAMLPIMVRPNVRICEHLGISHFTGKKVKIDNKELIAIQEQLFCCNCPPSFEEFFI